MKLFSLFKHLFIIEIIILVFNSAEAQCTLEGLLPIKLGITKFDARNQINSSKEYKPSEYDWDGSKYIKLDYNSDSVKVEHLFYDINKNICINSNDMSLYLFFADDILYESEIDANFDTHDFNNCKNIFTEIVSIVDSKYLKFKAPSNIYLKTKGQKEKIGTGFIYTILDSSNKVSNISISYSFVNAPNYNGRIIGKEKYVLEISQVNLFPTRLTKSEY